MSSHRFRIQSPRTRLLPLLALLLWPAVALGQAGNGGLPAADFIWHDRLQAYAFGDLSMLPGVIPGQGVWVDPSAYAKKAPVAGDVVLVKAPSGTLQMRRVVGVAGDAIAYEGGRPKRNGKPLERGPSRACKAAKGQPAPCVREQVGKQRYSAQYALLRATQEPAPHKVDEGQLYLLSDYRDRGEDSRSYGPVPVASVAGKVIKRSACKPASKAEARPQAGARTPVLGTGLLLELPAGFEPRSAAGGEQVLASGELVISVREIPVAARGLAYHFRKVAQQSGATATRGRELRLGGECGFLIEGVAQVDGRTLDNLWVVVGDGAKALVLNLNYPHSQKGKLSRKARRIAESAYRAP